MHHCTDLSPQLPKITRRSIFRYLLPHHFMVRVPYATWQCSDLPESIPKPSCVWPEWTVGHMDRRVQPDEWCRVIHWRFEKCFVCCNAEENVCLSKALFLCKTPGAQAQPTEEWEVSVHLSSATASVCLVWSYPKTDIYSRDQSNYINFRNNSVKT